MKVSLNWLKGYVDIRMDTKALASLLTMAGLEVEQAVATGEGFDKVVVAEIRSIRRHPNADRLSLVEVTAGGDPMSIVCGATNIREGQRVPLALVGSQLPNGMKIRSSKIRGVPSDGMLCSAVELGLGQDSSGILILSADKEPGMNLGEALGVMDTVLEVSITPNRPDCLCVLGIAREVAALTGQRVRYPSPVVPEGDEIHRKASVTIVDPDLCPRYVARLIEGVRIGPSPEWVKTRLENVGIRSINNVVDVTNYVMIEYNQPLHAFDFERLEGRRIIVRRAAEGEEFTTLDGVKRFLDGNMLMICDAAKPVAIAGVMGGLNSEISEATSTVLLESAYFDPTSNRRTSKILGLETEASYRFGRGIDYGGCVAAANRAAQLIQEWAGGRIVPGLIDAYPRPLKPRSIVLKVAKIGQVLGTEVLHQEAKGYLEALEIKVDPKDEETLVALPPAFRGDLEREIDLIEEIARLHGYDKVPVTLPSGPPASRTRSRESLLQSKAVDLLIHHGFQEVVTYTFTSPASLDVTGLPAESDPVRILNPLTEDFSVLRTTLIPGLLETARYNAFRKNTNLRIFELKKVFLPRPGEPLPEEAKRMSGFAMGMDRGVQWAVPPRPIDFYDVKGSLESVFEALQIPEVRFERSEDVPYLHPERAARIFSGEKELGVLGEVHPEVMRRYEISGRAYLFDCDFTQMVRLAREEKRFQLLPKFPPIYRDLSLVVDESLDSDKVLEAISRFPQPFLEEISLFDVYKGPPIPEGKKGLSYRIRYQSGDRTLTDEEVNLAHETIISNLKETFRFELRQ